MPLGPRARVLLIAAVVFAALAALVWYLSTAYWSQPVTPLAPPRQTEESATPQTTPTPAPTSSQTAATPSTQATPTPPAQTTATPTPSPTASPAPSPRAQGGSGDAN